MPQFVPCTEPNKVKLSTYCYQHLCFKNTNTELNKEFCWVYRAGVTQNVEEKDKVRPKVKTAE